MMKVKIRCVVYESADAAAKALNVTRGAIYMGLHRGRLDKVGLPPGVRGASLTPYFPSIPTRIGKLEFPSRRAASRALGMSHRRLCSAFKSGDPVAMAKVMRRAMQYQANLDAAAKTGAKQ